jgi:transcriptional regulator with XRE-family HTH domain
VLRGLTQRDLADFAGKSERWVRYLENDRALLDHRTARMLATGLRVDVTVVLSLSSVPSNLERKPAEAPSLILPYSVSAHDSRNDIDPEMAAMDAFRVADRQIGGGHLYAALVAYLNGSVAPRLLTARAPSFAAAASLTEMAGWMAHDSGRDDLVVVGGSS